MDPFFKKQLLKVTVFVIGEGSIFWGLFSANDAKLMLLIIKKTASAKRNFIAACRAVLNIL